MKKTKWYPVSIHPVRGGIYEVRGCVTDFDISDRVFFRGQWSQLDWKTCTAFGSDPRDKWRGLTEPQQ